MQSFGRGAADFSGPRLDTELVHFDMGGAVHRELRRAEGEDGAADGTVDRGLFDRIEPALHIAIERIIVPALIMGLVRLADEIARCVAEGRVATAAVAPAIGHIEIRPQIVPAGGKRMPFGHAHAQLREGFGPRQARIALSCHHSLNGVGRRVDQCAVSHHASLMPCPDDRQGRFPQAGFTRSNRGRSGDCPGRHGSAGRRAERRAGRNSGANRGGR